MNIVFVSNFMNHHQKAFCDALYKLTDGDFLFVETERMPQAFKHTGYPTCSKPYIVRAWESDAERKRALHLCANADVLIAGGAMHVEQYEKERLMNNKLTFEYAERTLKRGLINLFSPTNIRMQLYYHTLFYNKPLYKLCASAYTANDMYFQHSFKGKCFKFGYFPQIDNVDIEEVLEKRNQDGRFKFLWCARLIKWKHPEMAILLADRLYKKGYDFELNMVGSGPLYNTIERMIVDKGLTSRVRLLGNHPNAEVLDMMSKHHIFLFTSDRNEGWGAVLNEAMGRGCCPVASHLIGSVPFLLKHNENGMVFESGNIDSLEDNVVQLLQHNSVMNKIAREAYSTVKELWNPKLVAERFLILSQQLLIDKTRTIYNEGPLSLALPISEDYVI